MLVENVEDELGRGDHDDRIVRIKRVEDQIIRRVINPRDTASLRFSFCKKRDDEIVFIVASVRHDDVGTANASPVEDERIATVADDGHCRSIKTLEHLGLTLVLLDDDDFVTLIEKRSREIRADFSAADDEDEHRLAGTFVWGVTLWKALRKGADGIRVQRPH